MITLKCKSMDYPIVLRIDEVNISGYRSRITRSTYSEKSMQDELRLLRPQLTALFGAWLYAELSEKLASRMPEDVIDITVNIRCLQSSAIDQNESANYLRSNIRRRVDSQVMVAWREDSEREGFVVYDSCVAFGIRE